MAEAEREKQELHEEKLKAVENVEKHVRKKKLIHGDSSFFFFFPSDFEFHNVQTAHNGCIYIYMPVQA